MEAAVLLVLGSMMTMVNMAVKRSQSYQQRKSKSHLGTQKQTKKSHLSSKKSKTLKLTKRGKIIHVRSPHQRHHWTTLVILR